MNYTVLVVDCRDSITWDAFSNWDWWEMWDLIISTDYNQNVFNVLKNRWGECSSDIPLDLLGTFLYNPHESDAYALNMLKNEHNNLFATRAPEQ